MLADASPARMRQQRLRSGLRLGDRRTTMAVGRRDKASGHVASSPNACPATNRFDWCRSSGSWFRPQRERADSTILRIVL